ncbi:hypothetical protein OG987_38505 [Streptomyces sp. NBC_01620]|uniref:hypothetical protein n=1 Tax=Streptomyces sp. NBC_01620 TaxID=2975902 RepID=UPI0038671999|nr:hypothetical protein OG987_38505 [Streptomyces sp. NBC_01620]
MNGHRSAAWIEAPVVGAEPVLDPKVCPEGPQAEDHLRALGAPWPSALPLQQGQLNQRM